MRGRYSSTPFVGRAAQLATLTAAFETAATGVPAVIVVGGEAGVGKTRLVTEFLETVGDATVLTGGCVELGQTVLPLAPFVGILRQVSATLGPDEIAQHYGAELDRFLPGADSSSPPDPGLGQAGLFEAVLTLVARAAEDGPVVVVLEDLHWADRSSLDLLTFLVRNLGQAAVLLIGTYRSDEMRRMHAFRPVLAELTRLPWVERVQVDPLTASEVADLITAGGGTAEQRRVEAIVARAEGNPFFVEELMACDDRVGLPTSLRDILAARLESLPDEARQVLRVAAAAGRRVDHRLLELVGGLPADDLERGLRDAVEGAALVPDDDGYGYRFRHALLQEAVHEQLLPGERVRLHRAFSSALRENPSLAAGGAAGAPAELAHHALAAQELDLAFESLVQAGNRARDLFAFFEAHQHYRLAAELWSQVAPETRDAAPPRWELLREAGLAARRGGEMRESVALLRETVAELEESTDPRVLAMAWSDLSESFWTMGNSVDSIAASDTSVACLPEGDLSRYAALVLSWRSRLFMLLGRYDEGVPPGREAVRIAREIGAQEELCRGLNSLGTSLATSTGDPESLKLLEESISVGHAVSAGVEVLRGYNNLSSSLHAALNDLPRAEQVAREGLAYAAQERIHGQIVDWLRLNLVECLTRLGRWTEADEVLSQIRPSGVVGAMRQYYAFAVADLRVRQGRYDDAEAAQATVEEMADETLNPDALAALLRLRALLKLARGSHDLGTSLELVDSLSGPELHRVLAMFARVEVSAAVAGDAGALVRVSELRRRLEALQEASGQSPVTMTSLDGWMTFVDAEIARGSGTPDPELWSRAVEALAGLYCTDEELYARWRLGEALAGAGENAEAGAVLTETRARAVEIGATPVVEAVDTVARRARLKLAGMRVVEPGQGLTSREREVLALVSAGRTNREIGQLLFISEKTASVHVSNILAKIGAVNRVEAAAKARDLGLVDGL